MRRASLAFFSSLAALLVGTWAFDASADPQWNAGVDIGVAGRGEGELWGETAFWLGARGDVLFGRSGGSDFGLGPYVDVGTLAFDELDFGGGASFLLPVLESFPLVLSAGAYGRAGEGDPVLTPGVQGSIFWGSRSYDHHGAYEMAGGLLVEVRRGIGDRDDAAILIGAHVDALILALPFLFLAEAASGPSSEAAPIEPLEREPQR